MTSPAKHRKQDMRTRQLTIDNRHQTGYNNQQPTSNNQHPASKGGPPAANGQRDDHRYALRRGLGFWELTFEGQQAIFKHELGALYVACLLLDPPREPIHAVALALKADRKS